MFSVPAHLQCLVDSANPDGAFARNACPNAFARNASPKMIEYRTKWRSQPAMRLFGVITLGAGAAVAQDLGNGAWQLELKGEGAQAREQLAKAAESSSASPAAIEAYAEFLDRHRDPAA